MPSSSIQTQLTTRNLAISQSRKRPSVYRAALRVITRSTALSRRGNARYSMGTFRNNAVPQRDSACVHAADLPALGAFPRRRQITSASSRCSRTLNKNLSTPFERSSPYSPVRLSYILIGRTRSGDGAAARLPLGAAGRTVNGCSRADQSRRPSAANVPSADVAFPTLFFLFSSLFFRMERPARLLPHSSPCDALRDRRSYRSQRRRRSRASSL